MIAIENDNNNYQQFNRHAFLIIDFKSYPSSYVHIGCCKVDVSFVATVNI